MYDRKLTSKHIDDLLGGEWLNDCHIHAAQQLIQLDPDLRHIRGLQDPSLVGGSDLMLFVRRWCKFFIPMEITGL